MIKEHLKYFPVGMIVMMLSLFFLIPFEHVSVDHISTESTVAAIRCEQCKEAKSGDNF